MPANEQYRIEFREANKQPLTIERPDGQLGPYATRRDASFLLGEVMLFADGTLFPAIRVKRVFTDDGKVKIEPLEDWGGRLESTYRHSAEDAIHQVGSLIQSVARPSRSEESARYRSLAHVDREIRTSASANLAARILGKSTKEANHTLKVGRSQRDVNLDMDFLVGRIQDTMLDPLDIIHGVGQEAVDIISRIERTPILAQVWDTLLAENPPYEEAVTVLINLNSITSRDPLMEKIVVLLYSMWYNRFAVEHKFLGANLVPDADSFAISADRRVALQNLTALNAVDTLLSSQPSNNPVLMQHQRSIATAYVQSLDRQRPPISPIIGEINERADVVVRQVEEIIRKIPGVGKILTGDTDNPEIKAAHQAIINRLKGTKTIREFTLVMIEESEIILARKDISKAERVRWQQAQQMGRKVLATYERASQIVSSATK